MLTDLKIKWHFIGHLQKNKAEKIINEIDCLHSLDSTHLAEIINKKRLMPLDVFIQVNLTNEPQKSGISKENISSFVESLKKYDKINVIGLMVIGKENDSEFTEQVFKEAYELNQRFNFKELSMGMTGDYIIAIKNHSTVLRLGSLLKRSL